MPFLVDTWLEDEEQLVIAGDWNKDVTKDWIEEFKKRQLLPAITGKHQNEEVQATYNDGSYPIDEIFASSTLAIENAGYLEFGQGQSDHRPIWVDFSQHSFLGTKLPPLTRHNARKLKTTDPRTVDKYNEVLEAIFTKHDVYHRTHRLLNSFSNPLTNEQAKEFEKLDRIRIAAMKTAERNAGN